MTTRACFVSEIATDKLLSSVSNMCAECYNDLKEGDTIHYDMQNYRYLCQSCQEIACEHMNDDCEVIYDESEGLFSL